MRTLIKNYMKCGFNCVRYYMNYEWYETDLNKNGIPDIFDRIDRNIKWAKKYNIKLILNMHIAQGGSYEGGFHGYTLWDNSEITEDDGTKITIAQKNREELKKLWVMIADKYKDEDTILGYGILNEPMVLKENKDDTVLTDENFEEWAIYLKNVTLAIQKVDKNHLVFLEGLNGTGIYNENAEKRKYENTSAFGINEHCTMIDKIKEVFSSNEEKCLGTTIEENYVFEFHYYSPWNYTYAPDDENRLTTFKKDNIKKAFDTISKCLTQNDMPVFVGEFGINYPTLEYQNSETETNGSKWIEYVIQLCKENNMGFSYHVYKGYEFGMYSAYNVNKTTEHNKEWLRSKIKKAFIKSINGLVSDNYKIEDIYISNIEENTNVETLLNNLETNGTIEIYNHNNEKIQGQATIGTGMKLLLSNEVEYHLIVNGDLNGDGKISITDLSKIKSHIIGKQILQDEYKKAADMNGDEICSITDISKMKKYLVEK